MNRICTLMVLTTTRRLALLLLAALVACRTLAVRPEPGALLHEDFSGSSGVLPRYEQEDGSGEYADGSYRMWITKGDNYVWSLSGRDFSDVAVEATVVRTAGPRNGYFGVICRATDSNHFYGFVVSPDGRYRGIVKVQGSEFFLLAGDEHSSPLPGAAPDGPVRVRGECAGPSLRMYVNGRQVAQAHDTSFPSGKAGLLGGTQAARPGLHLRFDDFAVRPAARPMEMAAAAMPQVLFRDDFSDPESGWQETLDAAGGDTLALARYTDGGFRIYVEPKDRFFQLSKPAFGYVGDVRVEVDVLKRAGADESVWGLVCRQTSAGHYWFGVSSDGYYAIAKREDDQFTALAASPEAGPNRIAPGQHRVAAECAGDRLRLFVDGEMLLESRDSSFHQGAVRLSAQTAPAEGRLDLLFDNFTVVRP